MGNRRFLSTRATQRSHAKPSTLCDQVAPEDAAFSFLSRRESFSVPRCGHFSGSSQLGSGVISGLRCHCVHFPCRIPDISVPR